jgi:hypothetical protein
MGYGYHWCVKGDADHPRLEPPPLQEGFAGDGDDDAGGGRKRDRQAGLEDASPGPASPCFVGIVPMEIRMGSQPTRCAGRAERAHSASSVPGVGCGRADAPTRRDDQAGPRQPVDPLRFRAWARRLNLPGSRRRRDRAPGSDGRARNPGGTDPQAPAAMAQPRPWMRRRSTSGQPGIGSCTSKGTRARGVQGRRRRRCRRASGSQRPRSCRWDQDGATTRWSQNLKAHRTGGLVWAAGASVLELATGVARWISWRAEADVLGCPRHVSPRVVQQGHLEQRPVYRTRPTVAHVSVKASPRVCRGAGGGSPGG